MVNVAQCEVLAGWRVEHRGEARTPEVDEIRDVLTLDFNESQADRRERDALQNLRAGR